MAPFFAIWLSIISSSMHFPGRVPYLFVFFINPLLCNYIKNKHLFNGLLSRTAWVSRHQNGKHSGDNEWVGSGISSFAIQSTLAPYHSIILQAGCQTTMSKHWRNSINQQNSQYCIGYLYYRHSEIRLKFSQSHINRQSRQINLISKAAEINRHTNTFTHT